MENYGMWHEQYATIKPDKVVVKKRDKTGTFDKSIIIPTTMYPLNGKYEVFTYLNTSLLSPDLYSAIDSVEYRIGKCYTNAGAVTEALKKAGAAAISYAGWLFLGESEFPIHHEWTVVDGNIVVDLADDNWLLYTNERTRELIDSKVPIEEMREYLAEFHTQVKDLPNSARCAPVGIPTPMMFYVGCPCEPEDARNIYRDLMKKFPGHECERNVDASGMNTTQKLFWEKGLIQL